MPSTQDMKIIVLIVLFISTFFFSMIPLMCLSVMRRRGADNAGRRKTFDAVISVLSCYAAGVFLSTCLLDLFPDVQEKLSNYMNKSNLLTAYPVAEFIMTCGMFLILIIEQIVLTFHGDDDHFDDREPLLSGEDDEGAESSSPQRARPSGQRTNTRVSFSNDREFPDNERTLPDSERTSEYTQQGVGGEEWDAPVCSAEEHHYTGRGPADDDAQSAVYQDPNSHSAVRSLLLLTALSLHSVFEGLAVGLQGTASQVLQIFAALALHKSIIAFSLGINLSQSRLSLAAIIRSNLLFSITSPLGIGIGIAIMDLTAADSKPALLVNIILQGLACGTFLYIVFFEVLPHEFNSNKTYPSRLLKVLFLVLGYATVAGLLFIHPSVVRPICQKGAQPLGPGIF